jgi:leucine-rich repeat protein SHOC2
MEKVGFDVEILNSIKKIEEGKTDELKITDQYWTVEKLDALLHHISDKTKLKRLIVRNCQLKSIPYVISQFKNITHLDLQHNLLREFPDNIGYLKQMTELLLNNNEIEIVNHYIGNLRQLAVLDLQHNKITKIPLQVAFLRQLKILHLNNNKLQEHGLPKEIFLPKGLLYLGLHHNQLTGIPKNIGHLIHLRELRINNNNLEKVCEEIGYLKDLLFLDLQQNHLTSLPEDFYFLTKLEELYLGNNQLDTLSKSVKSLKKLKYLGLQHNHYVLFPESISYLRELKWLDLQNNQISLLPNEMGKLTKLEYLFLNHNECSQLPSSIQNLSCLKELHLGFNNFKSLPCFSSFFLENGAIFLGSNNNFARLSVEESKHADLQNKLLPLLNEENHEIAIKSIMDQSIEGGFKSYLYEVLNSLLFEQQTVGAIDALNCLFASVRDKMEVEKKDFFSKLVKTYLIGEVAVVEHFLQTSINYKIKNKRAITNREFSFCAVMDLLDTEYYQKRFEIIPTDRLKKETKAALLSVLFTKDSENFNDLNKFKIAKKTQYFPSLSSNLKIGFSVLKGNQPLIDAIVVDFCVLNKHGFAIINDEGAHMLDQHKLDALVVAFKKKRNYQS